MNGWLGGQAGEWPSSQVRVLEDGWVAGRPGRGVARYVSGRTNGWRGGHEEACASSLAEGLRREVPNIDGMTRITTVTNQKGGVGKSTTSANLAASWGRMGQRTLVIDLDAQGDASKMFNVHPGRAKGGAPVTIADALTGDAALVDARVEDVAPGVDLLRGSVRMRGVAQTLAADPAGPAYLKAALQDFDLARYARVVVDTPPMQTTLTVGALVASDDLVVPIDMTDIGAIDGARSVLSDLDRLSHIGAAVKLAALVRVRMDRRRRICRALDAELEALPRVARTVIPQRGVVQDAIARGVPVVVASPDNVASTSYLNLALELDGGVADERTANQAA